jgi:hypothetical protein
MCGIEKQAKIETKAQPVVISSNQKHKRLLKRLPPGRQDRRKHGVNPDDSGRFPHIFLKNTIDKNPALE